MLEFVMVKQQYGQWTKDRAERPENTMLQEAESSKWFPAGSSDNITAGARVGVGVITSLRQNHYHIITLATDG